MLATLAVRLSEVAARFVPSGCAISLILIAWGNGFWTLVPFATPMALVVLSGSLVSPAPVVDRGFAQLAGLARSPRGAIVLMALVSMGLAWAHWGLSLIGVPSGGSKWAIEARRRARRLPGHHGLRRHRVRGLQRGGLLRVLAHAVTLTGAIGSLGRP